MHRVALYSGTWELIKHKCRNKTYISDEPPHAMELCISYGIKVEVEALEGESISQMCRCTRRQSWHRGDRRNDWVWVTQLPGRYSGTLNMRLPWQLQQLFKLKLLNEDRAFVEYWLALALKTIRENSGDLDPVSTFVHVRKAVAAVALPVISMGNIIGCTHRIPEIANCSITGDRRNERWIFNSHIDLVTWNNVYN